MDNIEAKENEDEIKDCEIYINDKIVMIKKLILLIIINLKIKEDI